MESPRPLRKSRTLLLICQRGHAMTPENTYTDLKRGSRACKECKRISKRKRYFEAKEGGPVWK